MEKPWNNVNKNDYKWFRSSNHHYLNILNVNTKNIDAFIIVQDCNMAGEYYRIVFWIDNERFFDTTRKEKWFFDSPMENLELNNIITDKRTNTKYIVTFSEKFYKILEKI